MTAPRLRLVPRERKLPARTAAQIRREAAVELARQGVEEIAELAEELERERRALIQADLILHEARAIAEMAPTAR